MSVSQSKDISESTEAEDIEAAKPLPQQGRITFEPETRPNRFNATTTRNSSTRRDSITSIRSRTQSVHGIPIEFRTLSFEVRHSQNAQTKAEDLQKWKQLKGKREAKPEDQDYYANLEYHSLKTNSICDHFKVKIEDGLSEAEATTRLSRDGKNTFQRCQENYAKKLAFYVFGGLCSVLWVGVVIFFICWRPLGDPNPAPYNLGLAILVLIVIFL